MAGQPCRKRGHRAGPCRECRARTDAQWPHTRRRWRSSRVLFQGREGTGDAVDRGPRHAGQPVNLALAQGPHRARPGRPRRGGCRPRPARWPSRPASAWPCGPSAPSRFARYAFAARTAIGGRPRSPGAIGRRRVAMTDCDEQSVIGWLQSAHIADYVGASVRTSVRITEHRSAVSVWCQRRSWEALWRSGERRVHGGPQPAWWRVSDAGSWAHLSSGCLRRGVRPGGRPTLAVRCCLGVRSLLRPVSKAKKPPGLIELLPAGRSALTMSVTYGFDQG